LDDAKLRSYSRRAYRQVRDPLSALLHPTVVILSCLMQRPIFNVNVDKLHAHVVLDEIRL